MSVVEQQGGEVAMMANGTIKIPNDWEMPNWCDDAPIPCTKEMLIRWMNRHHGVALSNEARMRDIALIVNTRYAPAECPKENGPFPATWEVWAFIVKHEKQRRGGQRSLLEGMI